MNKIKYLKFDEVNREKQPYLDKNGRPYYKVSMKVDGNENWLSGLAYQDSEIRKWKVNQEVDIVITPKPYNGKTYYNFTLPRKEGSMNVGPRLVAIEERIKKIEEWITAQEMDKDEIKAEDIFPSDMPF